MCSSSLLYGVRARAEISGVVVKCVSTFALAYGGYGALSFGVGQLAFAVVLLTQYYRGLASALSGLASPLQVLSTEVRWREAGAALLQVRSPAAAVRAFVGPESADLVLGFAGQGIVKHMLTEGDRLLLTALASRNDRGAYAVVANYGSLAARLLFQPVEESVRRLTAQSGLGLALRAASDSRSEPQKQEQQPPSQDGRARHETGAADTAAPVPSGAVGGLSRKQQEAVAAFTASSYLVSWVGLAVSSVGPAMAPLFVRYVMGRHWLQDSAVAPTLAVYCLYVLCMSLNGVTEAFATAIATTTRLHSANIVLAGAFACYAGIAVLLLPLCGTPGLVLAGCANMAIRTASSVRYIRASLAEAPGGPHSLAGCVPSIRVWWTALLVLTASMLSAVLLHVWDTGHALISVVAAALTSSGNGVLQRVFASYGHAVGHLLHTAVCTTGALALLASTWLFDRSRAAAGLTVLGRRRAGAAASATASVVSGRAGAAGIAADPSKEE
jgi:oligosaccharide translocation protein RFT1